MSDYKVFNYTGVERTWEELYEDNVLLQQENSQLKERIEKAIKIIDSFNLGKYDYSIPQVGIIDLLEALKGDNK